MKSPAAVLLTVFSFAAGTGWGQSRRSPDLESRIYHRADARTSTGSWGSISVFTDRAPTVGTDSMLAAELVFLPGKRLQPPHRHAAEEFQYVIEGTGTWSLNGAESPITTGDLMYAKPGDLHGIANTSGAPLRFLVIKWDQKTGQQAGAPPAPRN